MTSLLFLPQLEFLFWNYKIDAVGMALLFVNYFMNISRFSGAT
jgi:hypothetical protein